MILILASTVKPKSIWRRLGSQYQLLLMSVPFVLLVFIFSYVPLWGWIMAFQKYSTAKGMLDSPYVGFRNFRYLFDDPRFYNVLRNTLAMSFMSLIGGFIGAIALALLLNEVRRAFFKRIIQTVTYIPHFVSIVVIANITHSMLSPDGGTINRILMKLGWITESIYFMGKGELFWVIHTLVLVWKELGWSTIIYLAVLAGLNPELYEAAEVDGASRFQRIRHISIPGLMPTAVILLILAVGNLINTGYESQYLLGNALVIDYSEVIDLYSLDLSFATGQYSVGIALGMFKTIISVMLVVVVNYMAKKAGQSRLF